jgi:FAD-linked sulfhydryl oxidase
LLQVVLTMLAMLHPPLRAYVDPWTGQLFGEGGVEKSWNRPPPEEVAHGGVIMSKLGNETAK